MALLVCVLTLVGLGLVGSENATLAEDTCDLQPGAPGPWGELLQEWALSASPQSDRQGRIMALPPTKGYYVIERIDGPLAPPPPPPPDTAPPPRPPGHAAPPSLPPPGAQRAPAAATPPGAPHPAALPPGPLRTPLGPHNYNEWVPPPGGKIVNRPNSYDTFRPSYPAGYRPQRPAADRVDEPPPARKQVSETDLYLLGAIEKLVYRVDLMEKRLRRMEESVHYLVAGTERQPEPCASNFTRAGGGCYHWSAHALDWKGANLACRKLRAALLELPEPERARRFTAAVLADKQLRGNDFWTGGLNPGLLWIWSHSARPVETGGGNGTTTSSIAGDGRCLALVHDAAGAAYVYRGRDCATRMRFVCQQEDDREKLSNDIKKASRELKLVAKRKAKIFSEDVHEH